MEDRVPIAIPRRGVRRQYAREREERDEKEDARERFEALEIQIRAHPVLYERPPLEAAERDREALRGLEPN